ncbi:hypothetical protein SAMN05660297_03474 [Natronincola peptidivorans]|uniref:Uncharacterized protein n=1 Tax=Natronincola peptidivorans TaxID=426128 RepID=A0A1I0H1Z4_9FIRM|nr:hypothetical protein [Natronincola peptidivorans]SET77729.1 hypothetical protein SAMN05660297_03474 [Natronincola peptidivorans]
MFQMGLLLVLLGAVLVYGTGIISKIFKVTTTKGILILKIGGLLLAIMGAVLLFYNEVPEKLEFLRIIRF